MNIQDFTAAYEALKECSFHATFAFMEDRETNRFTVITRSLGERILLAIRSVLNDFVKARVGIDLGWSTFDTDRKLFIKTVHRLESSFGSSRMLRAMHRIGMNSVAKEQHGLLMTKRELSDLYHQLICVTKEDFKEILFEIKNSPESKRGISQDVWNELRVLFAQISSLDECSKELLEKLHALLIPSQSLKELFFSENPFSTLVDTRLRLYTGFTMRQSVAQTVDGMRRMNFSKTEWEFLFTKKLAQPDFEKGLVVRHPEGYLYFHEHLGHGGTLKRVFMPFGKTALAVHVLYRGTRGGMPMDSFADIRTTLREDRTNEIGTYGAIQSYSKTKELFKDKEKLVLLGYSLGGTHAQRDTIAFYKQVNRLITVCSPGIDTKSAQLFAEIIKEKRPANPPMEIVHASDEDDIVDAAGESLAGAGCTSHCNIQVLSYAPASGATTSIKKTILKENIISLVLQLYYAVHAHTRPTSLHEYTCTALSTEDPAQREVIEQILSHDARIYNPYVEQLRQKISLTVVPPFNEFIKTNVLV